MSDKPGKRTAEQVFNSALEIDTSEERLAFLDQACKGLYPEKDYHTLYFGEILACYEM